MATRASSATRWVALLRGINVGGKNVLPMRELREIFASAGCTDVQTYIQSGNVVYTIASKLAGAVASDVEGAIRTRRGLEVPVLVREAARIIEVARAHPFLAGATDEKQLHVVFLAGAPKPGALASLSPACTAGERFHLDGRELYLHMPNGVGKSKLTNAVLDRRLGTTSTVRNWRTVTKLAELALDRPQP